jgi:hypothetical protein
MSYLIRAMYSCRRRPTQCENPACSDDALLCPGYMICAPVAYGQFHTTNAVITIVFIVDYFVRVATVWAADAR